MAITEATKKARAVKKVATARGKLDRATQDLHDAIRAAWWSGTSTRDLEEPAQMSKSQIALIVKTGGLGGV